jgi:hypothetical protein
VDKRGFGILSASTIDVLLVATKFVPGHKPNYVQTTSYFPQYAIRIKLSNRRGKKKKIRALLMHLASKLSKIMTLTEDHDNAHHFRI